MRKVAQEIRDLADRGEKVKYETLEIQRQISSIDVSFDIFLNWRPLRALTFMQRIRKTPFTLRSLAANVK